MDAILRAEDFYQDVRETERILINNLQDELRSLDAQIHMTNKAQAIQHAPGWQDFQKCVHDAIDHATSVLIGCVSHSNDFMRYQQGRVQALRDVATMLVKGKTLLEELAKRKVFVQDRLNELLKRTPRAAVGAEQT